MIGIIGVLASVVLHFFGGSSLVSISMILFVIGAIPLVFGGSSLRPHNMIKSFAQQCSREPNAIIAGGLLEAMQRSRKTALTKDSLRMVYLAIETYAAESDADPDLVAQLRTAAETYLSKIVF